MPLRPEDLFDHTPEEALAALERFEKLISAGKDKEAIEMLVEMEAIAAKFDPAEPGAPIYLKHDTPIALKGRPKSLTWSSAELYTPRLRGAIKAALRLKTRRNS